MSASAILACRWCHRTVTVTLPDPLDEAAIRAALEALHTPATCHGSWEGLLTWPDGTRSWLAVSLALGTVTVDPVQPGDLE